VGVKQQREDRPRDIKFDLVDARVTTSVRVFDEAVGRWDDRVVDLNETLRMIADIGNLRVGYYSYIKGTGFRVWKEVTASEHVDKPDTGDHRATLGMRFRAKLDCEPYSVVEVRATASNLYYACDDLHTLWQEGEEEHAGLLPVAVIARWEEVSVPQGVVHVPVFVIVDWVPRPRDLPDQLPTPPHTKKLESRSNGSSSSLFDDRPPPEAYDGPREDDEMIPF
jgi:hypothetical protein